MMQCQQRPLRGSGWPLPRQRNMRTSERAVRGDPKVDRICLDYSEASQQRHLVGRLRISYQKYMGTERRNIRQLIQYRTLLL